MAGRRSCDKVAGEGNDKVAGDLSRLPMAARVHPWIRKIPSLEKLTTFWLVKSCDQKSWKIIDRLGHSEADIFPSKILRFSQNDKVLAGAALQWRPAVEAGTAQPREELQSRWQ